jgi:hypothetical protein
MRCDEVMHELSAPAGRLDPSALAGHLDACTQCAEFAEGSDRLDRLWEATRPADPTAVEIDRMWAAVGRALESPAGVAAAPVVLPMRRVLAWLVPAAAIAAAALLAFAPGLRRPEVAPIDGGGAVAAPALAGVAVPGFDIEPGEIQVIHADDATCEAHPMMTLSDTDTIPPTHAIYNFMEDQSYPQLELSALK